MHCHSAVTRLDSFLIVISCTNKRTKHLALRCEFWQGVGRNTLLDIAKESWWQAGHSDFSQCYTCNTTSSPQTLHDYSNTLISNISNRPDILQILPQRLFDMSEQYTANVWFTAIVVFIHNVYCLCPINHTKITLYTHYLMIAFVPEFYQN